MNITSDLKQLGFDEKKSRVYLALLELGFAKAHEISKKTKLPRPTVYDLLAKLSEEGLVSHFNKRGVKIFTAEHPQKLKSQLEDKGKIIQNLLPELSALFNSSNVKPHIRFYEGIEGVKTVFNDTLTAKNKLLRGILSMSDLYTSPGKHFMDSYVERRVHLGYELRVIRSKPKEVRQEDWPTSNQHRRTLHYAPSHMVFAMTTYIYDDKVSLISTAKENFGMVIESKEYRMTMENLFEALWNISTPA
ncbi:helix-turn-helix domain-containing protein [Candidatus Uhrbacteria bacterium]|nr:helix-turn-helix domain-containing protein [Candidatus Uhrbacteria bacterium]